MKENQSKQRFTEREWARTVGIGNVPKERKHRTEEEIELEEKYNESMKGVEDEVD